MVREGSPLDVVPQRRLEIVGVGVVTELLEEFVTSGIGVHW